jgi:hypothetical protein
MFNAAMYFDLHRVPELFCGFPRDEGEAQGIAQLGEAPIFTPWLAPRKRGLPLRRSCFFRPV